MWTSLLFTLYFILLVLFVCACAINSQRIKHKLRIHPRIASLMFPFFINFIAAQTVFKDVYPILSTLIPCLLLYYLGTRLENVRIIGLTGGIATGKSTLVHAIQAKLKLKIIDCDAISRMLSRKGKSGYQLILRLLGDRAKQFVFAGTGEIEREKFSNFVFQNPEFRRKLTRGMGRYIFLEIFKQIFSNIYNKEYLMLIDAPILYETKILEYLCYPVVVVGCPEQVQIERLAKRNKYTEQQAKSRIKSQMPLEVKKKKAQIYIDNTKSQEELFMEFIANTSKYIDKAKANSLD